MRRVFGDKLPFIVGALAVFGAYGIASLAISIARGWPAGFGDSFALWSWGRFLGHHQGAAIYDAATLRAAQLALGLNPGASYPFAYPPSFLLLLWPLGQLPGIAACVAVIAISLPLYLWATAGRDGRSLTLVAALVAPTTAIEIAAGQIGFLAAGLLAGGIRLSGSRPVAGGVLLGLLTYKPQLGLLVPVALIAARRWSAVAAASATALGLALVATLVFGFAVWPAWLRAIPTFSRQFAAENSALLHLMPTVQAALLSSGVGPAAAQAVQWLVSLAAAVLVWVVFRSRHDLIAGAALLTATLLATPYAFVYDMPIVSTAIIWVGSERLRTDQALGAVDVVVMVAAAVSPIVLVTGAAWGPASAVAILVMLLATIGRYRLSSPRPAAPVSL